MISLAQYLKSDFDIKILYGEKEPDEKEARHLIKDEEGITFKKVPSLKKSISLFADIKAYRMLSKHIKDSGCDIVHTHGSKSGFLGRLAAYKNKVPCIVHTFHGHVFHSYYSSVTSWFIIKFERWMAGITTKIVAIGSEQQNELANIYKIAPPEKLATIYLGVDKCQFENNITDDLYSIRQRYNFPANTIAVGIIGRMVAIKNFDLFAEVAHKILTSHSGKMVKFFIVGDGEQKEKVQYQLEKLNIQWCTTKDYFPEAQIIFTSWIYSVSSILKELDIVMLTSRNEGTPLSLIEAQFCGKPVIATDAGGVRDTFIDNQSGFLIPQNDVEMFVEKLSLLVNDRSLREEMGKRAAVFAQSKFSKSAEVENTKQLYNDCKNPFHT
ncbi:glycosyltransferase family 4 protein [Panacibacter ginsenosidivorans]|uniref:Glycosyltransferase family 4 protein n=1 Tax=Panacibacter ginsenosidivorans TaxID=1813871 RepID=A0A5B8VCJ3_9BACT|nr:glycosyltransferase [Panacibacter ginsenosidivorans]QEC68018.1 glycosyltransferase family 4 protein [Panacibacter ginsenosidivorans]